MQDTDSVSPFELAILVHTYLLKSGFSKSAACFKREARAHFRAVPSTGVRDLLGLLNEYVALKEQEQRRLALAGRSTLAQRLLEAVDAEAAEQQAAVTAAARAALRESAGMAARQQEAAAAHHAQAQWLQEQQAAMAAAGQGARPSHASQLRTHFVPIPTTAAAAAAAPGPQVTPTRQRKAAPRKRQRTSSGPLLERDASAGLPSQGDDGLGAAGDGNGGSWGSPLDLLNLQLDTEGLEALLDDGPLQLRFAENLAQHINHNISGAAGRPGSGSGAYTATAAIAPAADTERSTGVGGDTLAGSSGAAGSEGGFLAELLADPQTLLAELPADPQMAQVLQTVVRPSAACPAPPSKLASCPASAAVERRQQQHQPPSTANTATQQDVQHEAAQPGRLEVPEESAEAGAGMQQQQQQVRQQSVAGTHEGGSTTLSCPRDETSRPTQALHTATKAMDGGAAQRAPGGAAAATAAARKLNEGVVELGTLLLPGSDAELLADIESLF